MNNNNNINSTTNTDFTTNQTDESRFNPSHVMHNINDYRHQAVDRGRQYLSQFGDSAGSFVRSRPYVAIGIAALGGYLLSSLILPRRTKFRGEFRA